MSASAEGTPSNAGQSYHTTPSRKGALKQASHTAQIPQTANAPNTALSRRLLPTGTAGPSASEATRLTSYGATHSPSVNAALV